MARTLILCALLIAGCQGTPSTGCPRGTVPTARGCVADVPPPAPGDDAGAIAPPLEDAGTPPAHTDGGGGGWSIDPPGTPPPEPGCDEGTGECNAWEGALLAELAAARSCASPLALDATVQAIAERQAGYQAELDRMTAASPDGDLFAQIRSAGTTFRSAGAAFSVTRTGAADVMGRWLANPSTAPIFDECWTHAGVAFETSESGASYVTVILIAR